MRRLLTCIVVTVIGTATACSSEAAAPGSFDGEGVDRGAGVYAASCASCHGADLRGTDKGPSHLSVVYEPSHHGDAAFRNAIVNGAPQHHWGFGPMAPVQGLTSQDIDEVIAFVRSEQQRQGFDQ